MFVGIDYSKKYKGEEFPVTNIMEKLTPWVPQGLIFSFHFFLLPNNLIY